MASGANRGLELLANDGNGQRYQQQSRNHRQHSWRPPAVGLGTKCLLIRFNHGSSKAPAPRLHTCPALFWGTGLHILHSNTIVRWLGSVAIGTSSQTGSIWQPWKTNQPVTSAPQHCPNPIYNNSVHVFYTPIFSWQLPCTLRSHSVRLRQCPCLGWARICPKEVKVTTAHQQAAIMLGKSLGEFSWQRNLEHTTSWLILAQASQKWEDATLAKFKNRSPRILG